MGKKLICFLWGHKFVVKAATGQTFATVNRLTGSPDIGHYYVLKKLDFCARCGKKEKILDFLIPACKISY
jgi:hypothetical protein